jgi:acetyltransferase-like isoleucine patch superfamily enzyme
MKNSETIRAGGIQKQLFLPGNMFARYRDTVVGKKNVGALIIYEMVIAIANSFPTKFGIWLRGLLYPLIFAQVGSSVVFGKNLIIRRPGEMYIGDRAVIGDHVSLDVKGEGERITISKQAEIGSETIVSCTGGKIAIGKGTRIGSRCRLGSSKGLSIGEYCKLGNNSYIVGAAHAYDRTDIPIIEQPLTCRGANSIGNFTEIGDDVTVRDGVRIGDRVRVDSRSLVIGHIPEGTMVAGTPAAVIGQVQ